MPTMTQTMIDRPADVEHPFVGRQCLTWPGEIEALVGLLRALKPATIVEFGVHEGRTAWTILRNVPSAREYVGVDVLPGYKFETKQQAEHGETPAEPGWLLRNDARFTLLLRARGTLNITAADLPRADFVFVDGDHGEQAVRHDTALAREIVKPGGAIAWHDYYADTPTRLGVNIVLDAERAGGADLAQISGTSIVVERR